MDIVALEDGSVVVAGFVNGTWNGEPSIGDRDFAAVKLDSNGTVVWRWRVSRQYTVQWLHQSTLIIIIFAAKHLLYGTLSHFELNYSCTPPFSQQTRCTHEHSDSRTKTSRVRLQLCSVPLWLLEACTNLRLGTQESASLASVATADNTVAQVVPLCHVTLTPSRLAFFTGWNAGR